MSLDNFDCYEGKFLKATDVSPEIGFLCVDVKDSTMNNKESIQVELLAEQLKKSYDLRSDDVKTIKALGFTSPRQLLSKTIFFKIEQVKNPKTGLVGAQPRVAKIETNKI